MEKVKTQHLLSNFVNCSFDISFSEEIVSISSNFRVFRISLPMYTNALQNKPMEILILQRNICKKTNIESKHLGLLPLVSGGLCVSFLENPPKKITQRSMKFPISSYSPHVRNVSLCFSTWPNGMSSSPAGSSEASVSSGASKKASLMALMDLMVWDYFSENRETC